MEHTGREKPPAETREEELPAGTPEEEQQKGLAWRKRLIFALIVIVGISIFGRVQLAKSAAAAEAKRQAERERILAENPGMATGLVPGQIEGEPTGQEAGAEEKGGLDKLLPFLTEGGVAMLLGLALGIATRSFLKLILIVVAIIFIGIQFLAYKGILEVNWAAAEQGFVALKDYVLNVSDEHNLGSIVQHKVPSAGALTIGYFLGLKR